MPRQFAETYLSLLDRKERDQAGEAGQPAISEHAVQCLWYDQAFGARALRTLEGQRIEVVSPGFWNQHAGPDFLSAQIAFNGELHGGDVEIHLAASGWKAHGHHLDPRYDKVILHVVLDGSGAPGDVLTSEGFAIPTLVVGEHVDEPAVAELAMYGDAPGEVRPMDHGACSALLPEQGEGPLLDALRLAAEWRMLNKARAIRLRLERAGPDQALYEMLMYAAGVSAFKHHFQAIARHLPYERAVQLMHQEPLLLETALLHLAGLLPDSLPEGTSAVPHFARLRALRRDHLGGMRSLPLVWKRVGIRPANNPERRLAGMARLLARTAARGLHASVMERWRADLTPIERRREFEALFPRAMGFWAEHYTWTGQRVAKPVAPIGAGRIRSIVGNVFIPLALAEARRHRDRALEETVLDFFARLPKENDNHVVERMIPRLWGPDRHPKRLTFQMQQGLLQMHHDWCEPNPSCRNCTMHRYLKRD